MSETTGCMMCHSLYLKANGEFPCWDDVGEQRVLWRLEGDEAGEAGEAGDPPSVSSPALAQHPALIAIRQSFRRGELPFADCRRCAVRGCGAAGPDRRTSLQVLHLEAS